MSPEASWLIIEEYYTSSIEVEIAPVKSRPKDELDAFYAAMGDVLESGSTFDMEESVFSLPNTKESPIPAPTPTTSVAPAPTPVIQNLPSLPTTAKVDKVQLAGIAAVQAAEQLAKAEEKKRKAGQASIGIGGGGKKVNVCANVMRSDFVFTLWEDEIS